MIFCKNVKGAYLLQQIFTNLMSNMSFVDIFNACVFAMFTVCYFYQLVYVVIVLLNKTPKFPDAPNHKYAVLISARNEREVIADLISSIRAQNYPAELIDIFLCADNCTDDTAAVARSAGAIVYERNNLDMVGKGYALDFLLKNIWRDYPGAGHEAYFVFDADNVLDENYFLEMNKVFHSGAPASTSYRNSKNYDSNWISAGYSVWFMREAKFLSQARLLCKTGCAISGTGFFIRADIIKQAGGWVWHLLTEDIEFSAYSATKGARIAYCPQAVLYDEQPVTFRDAWNQRFRWAKGFYQVFWNYGAKLFLGMFKQKWGHKFACYDMLMTVSPAMLLTIITIAFNAIIVVLGVTGAISLGTAVSGSLSTIFFCLFMYMLFMFVFGVITTFVEWESMHAAPKKKILYMFTFPCFMITYIPIALWALIRPATWKPIKHTISVDTEKFAKLEKTKGKGVVESTPAQKTSHKSR